MTQAARLAESLAADILTRCLLPSPDSLDRFDIRYAVMNT
ncbi:hypothetical protein BTL_5128 [Burkholderia thailandensis H0587]|nr:hypothetical protein BTL_5128 [Burkholderia thailandensis H0587]